MHERIEESDQRIEALHVEFADLVGEFDLFHWLKIT